MWHSTLGLNWIWFHIRKMMDAQMGIAPYLRCCIIKNRITALTLCSYCLTPPYLITWFQEFWWTENKVLLAFILSDLSSNPKKAACPGALNPTGFWDKEGVIHFQLLKFTWSLPKISSWWLSNHQFGNRQICNRWPGKWWGCTLLLILPGGLAPQRAVWGWSLAVQKLTTRRPPRKESRQSGSQRKSTSPPGEGKRQRTKSRHGGNDGGWGGAGNLFIPKEVCLSSFRLSCQGESFHMDFWDIQPEKVMTILTLCTAFSTPEFERTQKTQRLTL